MKRPFSARRLVVDTNVARSASTSEHPISDACRQVLETMLTAGHQVVLTQPQLAEWQKHQSPFARNWLRRMASKKRWHVLSPTPDSGLTDAVHGLECTARARREMLMDVYLLESAVATDNVVLSLETNVLKLYCAHAESLCLPQPVAWVSPIENAPNGVAWVAAGADVATARCIPAGN